MIAGVNEDGPADRAKIRNGDIVLKFNGQDVKEMRTLPRIVVTPIPDPSMSTQERIGSDVVPMS